MPRGAIQEKPLVADKRALFDPADCEELEQMFKKTRREKEEALMLAVLTDAVACFQRYAFSTKEQEKKSFREAEAWILDKNNEWFFSFDSICESLELNSDYVRQGLLQWKEDEAIRQQSIEKQRIEVKRHRTSSGLDKRHRAREHSWSRI